MDLLESNVIKNELRAQLAPKLGHAICAYTVEVTGISLTAKNTRDAVFVETKTYDMAKLAVLLGYVDSLFKRLSRVPATIEKDSFGRLAVVVVDPVDGEKFDVGGLIVSESWAREAANTKKLTLDEVWGNIPTFLYQHRYSRPVTRFVRVARLQLFDDGWRVVEVSP